MTVKIDNYDGKYRIVSLALDQAAKEELLNNDLDFLLVADEYVKIYPEGITISENKHVIEELQNAHNYDVYELWENGKLTEYYDDSSVDNYFFITAKCNSNCVMCPSPDISRRKGGSTSPDALIEIAKHIPTDTSHLTITGGEPFMMGREIFRFMEFLRNRFEYTEFLFLTNGRIFSVNSYVEKFVETAPGNSVVAIPIHGSNAITHDLITQSKGSFVQTVQGIKNLLKAGIYIELRIVISKLNAKDLYNIAKLISGEMTGIGYVSIMAMEMTGSAWVNRDTVWISYTEAAEAMEPALLELLEHGIDVKLYNFPLCTVKKQFWTLCEKSISPDKVRYVEICDNCRMKKSCGGVFAGTISIEKGELKAIL